MLQVLRFKLIAITLTVWFTRESIILKILSFINMALYYHYIKSQFYKLGGYQPLKIPAHISVTFISNTPESGQRLSKWVDIYQNVITAIHE